MRRASRVLSVAPLALCVALMFQPAASASPGAPAAGLTIAVGNCNDSGPGSLRAAVAGALSGDTIDLTALDCRRIDLISGAIAIPQDDLVLVGPAASALTIDAGGRSSVFRHAGTGTLRIDGVTIARGVYRSDTAPLGGCVYSAGSIELTDALVRWCNANPTGDGFARGGGLYAAGAVTLINSQVLGNTAGHNVRAYVSEGGGIYAGGRLTARHSRICGNHARSGGGAKSNSAGVEIDHTTFSGNTGGALSSLDGDSVVTHSTISGNRGSTAIVAFSRSWQTSGRSAVIANSTISGNTSLYSAATVQFATEAASITNSTIAFNRHSEFCGRGTATVQFVEPSVHVDSTIIAGNTCNGNPFNDLYGPDDAVFTGANNLITFASIPLPPDTVSADPRLAPLADNGGPTQTHALLDGSPALDAGNNAAGLAHDQRGPGFPRVEGTQADIGAYER